MNHYDLLAPLSHGPGPEFVSGQGAALRDAQGNEYLDFNEICVTLGQGDAYFTEKMKRALEGLTCGKSHVYRDQLYELLMETTHGDFSAVHLTASGSESAEWAVKLAQKTTGRSEVLSFWNSIHGRTHLSASMSGLSKRKTGYGPLSPGTVFGIYPDCGHCPLEHEPGSCSFACLRLLDRKVAMESAQDIAAVIVEPYQGAGVICPPDGWLKELEQWARRRGALFVLDEIQSGMGRSGCLYHYQRLGLQPDMLLLGKSLGNGLHISALLVKDRPSQSCLPALTGGSGDNPLACAAACAVIQRLQEGLLDQISKTGDHLRRRLEQLQARYPAVTEIRTQGLAAAIELASPQVCAQVSQSLAQARVLTAPYGDRALMFKPPFSVTAEQIDRAVEAAAQGLSSPPQAL